MKQIESVIFFCQLRRNLQTRFSREDFFIFSFLFHFFSLYLYLLFFVRHVCSQIGFAISKKQDQYHQRKRVKLKLVHFFLCPQTQQAIKQSDQILIKKISLSNIWVNILALLVRYLTRLVFPNREDVTALKRSKVLDILFYVHCASSVHDFNTV